MIAIFLFLFGLLLGSFIAALSYRYPKKISVSKGRSFCPKCKSQINWFDNIPLLSFLFLGGKCRNCKNTISWRYPAIEAATGIGFLLIGFNLFPLVIFCILELIFIVDLEHQIIPNSFIFAGMLVAIASYQLPIFNGLFAGFICAATLLLIHLITRGRGMGLGDVKFAILGGLLVGLKLSFIWLFVAFLTGGAVAFILILVKGAKLKDKIAFGPFLIVAIPIVLVWGERILKLLHLSS